MVTDQQYIELLNRVSSLENMVKALSRSLSEEKMRSHNQIRQADFPPSKTRDIAYYSFDGNVYNKRDLVLACVKRYISDYNVKQSRQLFEVFPDYIQGAFGVLRSVEEAEKYNNAVVRYFFKDSDVLFLDDGNFVVSKGWTAKNIPFFLQTMENLGYSIKRLN